MRKPIIAANWKMNKSRGEVQSFASSLASKLAGRSAGDLPEIVVAPPFTALDSFSAAIGNAPVELAAQNVHAEESGAYTGEVSIGMLKDAGCRYVIIGHSERRALFGEPSQSVARKAQAILGAGLRPIVCVGETLLERETDKALTVISEQIEVSLEGVEVDQAPEIVVAYEPVWAIGTGRTATPEIAQETHAYIREQLSKRFGSGADVIRIQYGGSVKPGNIRELMEKSDIDGALVGGASLDPDSFFAIIAPRRIDL